MRRRTGLIGLLALVLLAPGLRLEAADLGFSLDSVLAAADSTEANDLLDLPATGYALLYFHQTYRCETCLEMERRIREALGEMSTELPKGGRFAFRDLDYQDGDNWDLVERFGIREITLAVTEWSDGQILDWLVLDKIWDDFDSEEFKSYIQRELRGYFSRRHKAEENRRAPSNGE